MSSPAAHAGEANLPVAVKPRRFERLRWLFMGFGSGQGGELVPQARLAGPMPWVIAIMVALTVIAAATGLALRNVAEAAAAELSGGVTIQILEAQPDLRQQQAKAALAVLATRPELASVRLVPQTEVDGLIAPWLGAEPQDGEVVPVPALIDVRLEGGVTAQRVAAIRALLRKSAPAARVDAQASWLKPVFGAIESLQLLAVALIVLLAVAMAASVLLAARTALGNHRETIEIVHMLGGTDAQIARIFQRSIGLDAAVGGATGLAIAIVITLLLGQRFAGLGAGIVMGGTLGWADWLVLGLIPVAGVVLAVITARLSVLAALRKML